MAAAHPPPPPPPPRARGGYRRISDVDRGRLIDAFENNVADYIQVADTLDIKHSTARSIVATYLRTGRREKQPRGGPRNGKVDQDMRDALQRMLEENPLLTLGQMKDNLVNDLPNKPPISPSTIARVLDGLLYTVKLAEDVPEGRNAPRVLDQRVAYANWFMQNCVIGHGVFIDECGYNIWTRRQFGRALRGQPVRRVVNNQRGKNCNITFAISAEVGLVAHKISMETTTRESFEDFLATTVQECGHLLPADEHIYFVYDNARPHVRAQLPAGANPNIQLKRLPPYSPFLNPTEMAHSCFKAAVKRSLALPEWQQRVGDRHAANQAGMNLQQWRANLLEEVAAENVGEITQEKCHHWYNHSQTYLGRCMARQPIEG